jgi:hypothetical protein
VKRRRVLVVLLVVVAVGTVAAGYWFLSPQQVSMEVNYSPLVAGKTVAVHFDGATVGEFAVPGNQSCNMSVGCLQTLPDNWLTRGLHGIRVTVNGTTWLDQGFFVSGRAYAWVVLGDGSARFGIGDSPTGWM